MPDIALIGPTGAGKSVLADYLRDRFNYQVISSGEMFRHNLDTGTALGLMARKYIEDNTLVPDEIVDAMIFAEIEKAPASTKLLFEGFPRTREQAQFLDATLEAEGRHLMLALYLDLPDALANERALGRTSSLHEHDTADKIAKRQRGFHRRMWRLGDYLADNGRLAMVDVSGTLPEAQKNLGDALTAYRAGELKLADEADLAELQARADAATTQPARSFRQTQDIVLLGGPGSGKGTQAERLTKELGIPHISTGDLFRKNIREKTRLGQMAENYIKKGELVPDDVTEAMVQDRLQEPDARDGFLLDGFPRTVAQAQALTEILNAERRRLQVAIDLKVSDEVIVERLSGRLVCRECGASFHVNYSPPEKEGICDHCGGELYRREDDEPATIRNRLASFHRQNRPLLMHYNQIGLLQVVDGEGETAAVTKRLHRALGDD